MTNANFSFAIRLVFWGLVATGLAESSTVLAATLSTVAAIPGINDGSAPYAGLTKLGGAFYGTTSSGGTPGNPSGVIFRVDLKSGAETIVHIFDRATDGIQPEAELLALGDKLYGTTTAGGSLDGGTVFAIDPETGAEQVLYNLPAESYDQFALVEFHGLLYGTGRTGGAAGDGIIFSVDPVGATGHVLHTFQGGVNDGDAPVGLTVRNATLYGATSLGGKYNLGTLFRFDPASGTVRLEYSFGNGSDGNYPRSSLTSVGGVLYGTTRDGGASGDGTVYSFDPESRQEAVLHSFDGTDGIGPGALLPVGRLLYAVTGGGGTNSLGTVFSIDPATGATNTIVNIAYNGKSGPFSPLIEAHGLLYGTLSDGGVVNDGSVYSVDPATGKLSEVYEFVGAEYSFTFGVIKVGASLYGTASGGGAHGLGSIFKVDPATGLAETLHSFTGLDGLQPYGGLVEISGVLYGTTESGGSMNYGTVFSFDLAGHKLTTLYQFTGGADGAAPGTTLSLDNGTLYGITVAGRGTVFEINLASLSFSTVFSFQYPAYSPSEVVAVNGLLYGEVFDGCGALYQLDPSTGTQTILHAFRCKADGELPEGGLLYSNGLLFGTTYGDGKKNPATVFSFNLATATKSTLYSSDKVEPQGPLVATGDKLFGAATFHKTSSGALLRLDATNGAAHLYSFSGTVGGLPNSPLLHVGQAYYGTTQSSDTTNAGTVFKFVP